MPAAAPPVTETVAQQLRALGAHIRQHRKRLGVSATATAEAAGMSRVTLHRIERGEPSVAMGAYLHAMAAIGLGLQALDTLAPPPAPAELPERIRLADHPQLRRLAWQLDAGSELTPQAAFDLYERNWRHVDRDALDASERALIAQLAQRLGGGRLLV